MRARLIWVGRERGADPETKLCERYLQRLKPFLTIDSFQIKGLKGDFSPEQTRQREAVKILTAIDSADYFLLCDERGQEVDSPGLAKALSNCERLPGKRLVLCIGGAMGVAPEVRQRADFVLSLSKLTLPHALARVLLLEQLYRAFCIKTGHPYHHES